MNDCYARQMFNGLWIYFSSGKRYISPEEIKILYTSGAVTRDIEGNKVFECIWPKCSCPLSAVTGAYHQEKINWIVQETIKNPKFKHKIRI